MGLGRDEDSVDAEQRSDERDTERPRADTGGLRRPANGWHLVSVFSELGLVQRAATTRLMLGTQTLGRQGEIGCNDPTLSRRHAEISYDGSSARVADLSSRNGLFVNGERVSAKTLSDGDVVRVGSSVWVAEQGRPGLGHHDIGRAIAKGTLPVIIQGETGTGKEILARLIHRESGRKGRFVAVDCASLPTGLAEAELFGHVRGAFSGAAVAREGLFRYANRGTILLDEIADLTPELQAKLLRVLESQTVRPLGAEEEVAIDVRVIAASPVELTTLVAAGRFRRDLYGRLAGRNILVPPLRHRRSDIVPLLLELGREQQATFRLTPEVTENLLTYSWPQNVRELKMFVRRVVEDVPEVTGASGERARYLSREMLEQMAVIPEIADGGSRKPSGVMLKVRRQRRVGKEELESALSDANGNISEAARILGRRRELVYRWKRVYGIN